MEKVFLAFVGVVVVSTVASMAVVAGAYGLFEALRAPLGAAGAGGLTALILILLLAAIAGLIALGRRAPPPRQADAGLSGKLLQLAREKPLLAAGVIAAAGVVIARNPKLVATAISAFMAGQSARKS
jgi:hypothetical protein